jgi:hypothetical protein
LGKRSDFERNPHDSYPTPYEAVLPLLPFLANVYTFAEPCCGGGFLIQHLERHRLRCVLRSDIVQSANETQLLRDARQLCTGDFSNKPDAIITNPPWTRDVLLEIIGNLKWLAPTWLLLSGDWLFNKSSAEYLPDATDIVAIGRVKWMPDSEYTGKENACWVRFVGGHDRGATFHPNW